MCLSTNEVRISFYITEIYPQCLQKYLPHFVIPAPACGRQESKIPDILINSLPETDSRLHRNDNLNVLL